MGQVDQIILSKMSQVQSMLDSVTSRTGMASIRFADVYSAVTASSAEPQNTASEALTPAYTAPVLSTGAKEVSGADNTKYNAIIDQAAKKYDLDPNLIKAVIRIESNFHANAVSGCGAMGLMQLMPGTAKELGVTNAFDPAQNIFGGAAYIKKQLKRFGDVRLALAAYNTGPGRIGSLHISNPDDPAEYQKISKGVRGYVEKALSYYRKYSA